MDTKYGVRLRELEFSTLAWFSPKLSPHTLPILILRKYTSELFFSNGWCVLRVRGGAPFIVPQGRYEAWRQLHAGKTVMLDFHAKGEHQRLTSGAGRPGVASDLPLPSRGCS